jgi:hypothetical protein
MTRITVSNDMSTNSFDLEASRFYGEDSGTNSDYEFTTFYLEEFTTFYLETGLRIDYQPRTILAQTPHAGSVVFEYVEAAR